MTQRFDQADVVVQVEPTPELFAAVRDNDQPAFRAALRALMKEMFAKAAELLTRAAKNRGLEVREPLEVAVVNEKGEPASKEDQERKFFVVVTTVMGERLVARIEFGDLPRVQ